MGLMPPISAGNPGAAKLDDFYQQPIAMMPGVTSGIVGWRPEGVVVILHLPGRLAFHLCSVTTGTMFAINLFSLGDLFLIQTGQGSYFRRWCPE